MKTKVLDNIVTSDELFFMYNQFISTPMWNITGLSSPFEEEAWQKRYNKAPNLSVKMQNSGIDHYPFYLWGKTVVYRIKEKLTKEKIGFNTNIDRMWLNITYSDNDNHWLHKDEDTEPTISVLLFLTPIWHPDWRGSFYVDGEEYNFKPGSAVIFDSKEFHTGTSPIKNTHGWIRLSCNIVLKQNKKTFGISK